MKSKIIMRIILAFLATMLLASWSWFKKDPPLKKIAHQVMTKGLTSEHWPDKVKIKKSTYQIEYTQNEKLENYIKKQIKRYRPDYVSVVVLDNRTGKVLADVDYTKKSKTFGHNLSLSSTHPAASLFKIVSAVDLLSKDEINLDKEFEFRGKRSTLYKGQLKDPKGRRWVRKTNLKKAFSLSNNVVFGRTAQQYSDGNSLFKSAQKMGIEHNIMQLLPLSSPQVMMPTNKYQIAEMASGFNKKTLISPIHGAVIAQIIANDGALKRPYLISKIEDKKDKEEVYQSKVQSEQRIKKELAQKVKDLMVHTVERGTARRVFLRRTKALKALQIGGKTGTITGGIPFGKRDWFSSFAIPKDGSSEGISVNVMMINLDKWFVRSSQLTKTIMNYYFNEIEQIKDKK